MVSNEFWVCECGINNLYVREETRCRMCGVWNDNKATRHVRVEDVLNMVFRYTEEGVRIKQLSKELDDAKAELTQVNNLIWKP